MNGSNNLAIIPARAGSKRIPGKNIKDFLGKPIIAYAIETALKSKLFKRVLVSTDSEEIASIARMFGAEVPFLRSNQNSDDLATLSDVTEEVLLVLGKNGEFFENVCCILPTSPLIAMDSLKKGLDLLTLGGFSSVRPVVTYSYPVQRAFRMKENKVDFLFPENQRTRSQDLEKIVHDAGQFYWFKASKGLKDENRGAFLISELHAQDIDTEEDWKMAELKFNLINRS